MTNRYVCLNTLIRELVFPHECSWVTKVHGVDNSGKNTVVVDSTARHHMLTIGGVAVQTDLLTVLRWFYCLVHSCTFDTVLMFPQKMDHPVLQNFSHTEEDGNHFYKLMSVDKTVFQT